VWLTEGIWRSSGGSRERQEQWWIKIPFSCSVYDRCTGVKVVPECDTLIGLLSYLFTVSNFFGKN
jgi:hypothetical protein